MQISDFARQLLTSPVLADKLRPPSLPLMDDRQGTAVRIERPARPENLQFAARRSAPAMPRGRALRDPHKRGIAHHIMANHELQAVEVMAWVLLAFPDAPGAFRQGLIPIIEDEQRHTRMHIERARLLGVEFGDFAVNSYIWQKAQQFASPLDYLAGLPLTFEARNLDHTLEFAGEFEAAGDSRSAALMRVIHRDEIGHVAFGIEWLRRLKPQHLSDWDAFESHLHWPLRPSKARGEQFHRASRVEAGLTAEFIDQLAATDPGSSDGAER